MIGLYSQNAAKDGNNNFKQVAHELGNKLQNASGQGINFTSPTNVADLFDTAGTAFSDISNIANCDQLKTKAEQFKTQADQGTNQDGFLKKADDFGSAPSPTAEKFKAAAHYYISQL